MDGFPTLGIPDTGDTAWMLASAALVLLMTPGLAFFYGGMVRAKSVLNMIMMSFSAMGVVTVLWVLYGYSMSFGNDVSNLFGDPTQFFGLKGLIGGNAAPAVEAIAAAPGVEAVEAVEETLIPLVFTMPATVFVAFQLMFAIITVALISGAVADRIKFGAWLLFAGLWVTFVYFPVAHWVFSFDGGTAETGGWIANKLAAIDFAGGTAVHINAGTAALVLVLILGKRRGWPTTPMRPHNLPFVMLGAGLLWFGWYGFNAGSATASGGTRRRRPSSPRRWPRRRRCWRGCSRSAFATARRHRWVPPRVWSPVWSPSRRRAPRSTWSVHLSSAWSQGLCAHWQSG